MNKRIDILHSLCPTKCHIIADIGCDHGYLTKKLVESKNADLVIASEITEKNLEKAKITLEKYKNQKIKFILSNGFKNFDCNSFPDCAIIAGMGGYEIINILRNHPNLDSLVNLILQPMKDECEVRKFLAKYYEIQKDFIIEIDGRFYTFIKAIRSNVKTPLNTFDYYVGKTSFQDYPNDLQIYLNEKLKDITDYLKVVQDTNQKEKLTKKLKLFNEIKEYYYGKNVRVSRN